MAKRPSIQTILAQVEEEKEALLGQINEGIEKIEERMKPYEALNQKKQELLAARRALLGGSKLTGAGSGTRITQADVVEALRALRHGTSHTIAEKVGAGEPAVRGHLNRGKDERFLKRDDGVWFLRDPKNGINDVDDLPEAGEEEDTDADD